MAGMRLERERERGPLLLHTRKPCVLLQRLPSGSDMGTVYGTKYDRLLKKEHKTPFSRISILFSIRSNSSSNRLSNAVCIAQNKLIDH